MRKAARALDLVAKSASLVSSNCLRTSAGAMRQHHVRQIVVAQRPGSRPYARISPSTRQMGSAPLEEMQVARAQLHHGAQVRCKARFAGRGHRAQRRGRGHLGKRGAAGAAALADTAVEAC
jgi:hypothetical protein